MRAARIARLMNDTDYEQIFKYELAGYPPGKDGLAADIWRLAGLANRYFTQLDLTTHETKTFAYLESIEALEAALDIARQQVWRRATIRSLNWLWPAARRPTSSRDAHSGSRRAARLRHADPGAAAYRRSR